MPLELSKCGRKYGAKRDVRDHRDRMFTARALQFAPVADTRSFCGPVKDQGDEGSCTGHAGSSYVEWVERRYRGKQPLLSPQDLYVQELVLEGDFPEDCGAQPRTICKVLTSAGVCEEQLYPYVVGQLQPSTAEQRQNALLYKQGAYHRLTGAREFVACLGDAVPWPVLVGFMVYESFESDAVARSGVMTTPQPGEASLGGHEVLGVGYDIGTVPAIRPRGCPAAALIQNSWGTDWGISGFFWMPLAVLESPDTDLWMVHPGRPW